MSRFETVGTVSAALCALLLIGACDGPDARKPAQPAAPAVAVVPAATSGQPAVAPIVTKAAAHILESGIVWLKDDYPAARKAAIEAGKPLVIDMWAPWCHTCLSMKHYVLTDSNLAAYADKYVWLALDTDRPENAAVLETYPVASWPTFFVVDADAETLQARLVGSATTVEFAEFLGRGMTGYQVKDLDDSSLTGALRRADRAAAAKDWASADAAYAEAMGMSKVAAIGPEVLVAWIGTRWKARALTPCMTLGIARLDDANRYSSAKGLDFAAYAAMCANQEGADPAIAKQLREAIVGKGSPMIRTLGDRKAPLTPDDKSDGLRVLREVYEALGDKASARATIERQRDLLKAAIEDAKTPEAAMTYGWHWAEVHNALGAPADAVPLLEASAKALPNAYDPPYRMAWALLKAKRPAEALPHAERALGLAYGPRKASVQRLIADIHGTLGDKPAERAARQAVVDIYAGLDGGHVNPTALEKAKAAVAALDTPPAAP